MENNREIIFLIMEITKAIRCCQQDAVFCENITFNQFFILDQISQKGVLRLADLHQILGVEKSTTTRLLDPLAKEGLIIREKSSEDSRAINVRLTEKGNEIHKKVWACMQKFAQMVEMNIPKDQRKEVFDNVKLFLKAISSTCITS